MPFFRRDVFIGQFGQFVFGVADDVSKGSVRFNNFAVYIHYGIAITAAFIKLTISFFRLFNRVFRFCAGSDIGVGGKLFSIRQDDGSDIDYFLHKGQPGQQRQNGFANSDENRQDRAV